MLDSVVSKTLNEKKCIRGGGISCVNAESSRKIIENLLLSSVTRRLWIPLPRIVFIER